MGNGQELDAVRQMQLDTICEKLAEGKGLLQICRDDETLPSRTTVNRWADASAEIASRIARARAVGAHAAIDECRDIVDAATPENWQVARLRVWERQWAASKVAPKDYGERLDVNHGVQTDKLAEFQSALAAGPVPQGQTNAEVSAAEDEPAR